MDVSKFLVINVAADILFINHKTYSCKLDDYVALVIEAEKRDEGSIINCLKEVYEKLLEFAHIETSVFLSNHYTNILDINAAYNECLYLLNRKKMFGGKPLERYDSNIQYILSYPYTEEDEKKITNAIKSANFEAAKEHIGTIFEKNMIENLSTELAIMLIYDITTTVLKLSDLIIESADQKQIIFNRLTQYRNIDEAKEAIFYAIQALCSESSKKLSDYKISDSIIEIIKKNYNDVNLSVAQIGDRLQKSPQYISRLFKKETSKSLSKYIHEYRILVAKDLLINTELSIKEIAKKVGYTNSNGFISSFKTFEGITPRQFKLSNKKDNKNLIS